MNKSKIKSILIVFVILTSLLAYNMFQQDGAEVVRSSEEKDIFEINNELGLKTSNLFYDSIWNNVTIISDGYLGNWGWNQGESTLSDIAVDHTGIIHAIWVDGTDGKWGNDNEIMYSKYSDSTGWSNATVISDGFSGSYWNTGDSFLGFGPRLAIDSQNNLHVVWEDSTPGIWGSDWEVMYANYSATSGQWSNATVISDGFAGSYWNNGLNGEPDIAVDSEDNLHVVWSDTTAGIWGSDWEVMYVNYSTLTGWSNVTIISDGFAGSYWNNDNSRGPKITIDSRDNLYVVWYDYTDGIWGTDYEIMYAKYSISAGWSNATVISDGYGGLWGWNNDISQNPDIIVDNNDNLHVVWEDYTNGTWGIDVEIMYTNYIALTGQWTNATVISDGYGGKWGWNNDSSTLPEIVIDGTGMVHVIWQDNTNGKWGIDIEIMHSYYSATEGQWSNATVISDGYGGKWGWNNDNSQNPAITVDDDFNVRIVWDDATNGKWGIDTEIMYLDNTLVPKITYNKIFNITASADDASNRGGTTSPYVNYTGRTLQLGNNTQSNNKFNQKICLRWNVSIPKNSVIIDAYLNLTFSKSSSSYNGFSSKIYAFNDNDTAPFSNVNENIRTARPRTSINVDWQMPIPTITNKSYTSPSIVSILQYLVERNDWTDRCIVGIYIEAIGSMGVTNGELLEFWSYNLNKLAYAPKLIIKWRYPSPTFISTPGNRTIRPGISGYHLDWIAYDKGPREYWIISNISGLVQNGTWTSYVPIKYVLSPFSVGLYEFTIIISNNLSRSDFDVITINVTNQDYGNDPILEIEFIQKGRTFSREERDYFITGDGPFAMKIYNSTPINIGSELSAYYQNYYNYLYVATDALGFLVYIPVVLDPYTINTLTYDLNYSESLGYFQFIPSPNDQYNWKIAATFLIELISAIVKKNVSSIEYSVLNYVTLNTDRGFVYVDTYYDNSITLEMINRDLTPPTYQDPEVEQPDDSSSNFEVEIFTYDEAYGSGIKNVALFYSVDDGPWKEIEMLLAEGKYRCGIPPQSGGAEIRYYIEISDLAGNTIKTEEETITSPTFKIDPIIVPVLGTALGVIITVFALSTFIYLYKKKKSSKETLIPDEKSKINKIFQKLGMILKRRDENAS